MLRIMTLDIIPIGNNFYNFVKFLVYLEVLVRNVVT